MLSGLNTPCWTSYHALTRFTINALWDSNLGFPHSSCKGSERRTNSAWYWWFCS
jgi:hypothetical protein